MINNNAITIQVTRFSELWYISKEAQWVSSPVFGPLNHSAKSGSVSPLSSIEMRPETPAKKLDLIS